jgi:hypothetical protein
MESKYRKSIKRDHKSKITRLYFWTYEYFWFHTEFWIKDPEQRRPYTYIFRDWIYPHMAAFIAILIIWYVGLGASVWFAPNKIIILVVLALGVFSGWLSAHLVWGGKWNKGEQEWPPILDA